MEIEPFPLHVSCSNNYGCSQHWQIINQHPHFFAEVTSDGIPYLIGLSLNHSLVSPENVSSNHPDRQICALSGGNLTSLGSSHILGDLTGDGPPKLLGS